MKRPQTPLELLRNLDRWLDATGHESGHPWRLSIAETLAAAEPDKSALTLAGDSGQAGKLFGDIAGKAYVVSSVLADAISMDEPQATLEVTIAMVQQLGWLADRGAARFGGDGAGVLCSDADDWFLSPCARQALGVADLSNPEGQTS